MHWLLNSSSPTMRIDEVRSSSLASVRLRAGAFASRLDSFIDASFGRQVDGDESVLLVGKIGAENIESRARDWLQIISKARNDGKRVIIDYTDHHVGFSSVMSAFYINALEYANHVVVPSREMQRLLIPYFRGQISIIADALEVPVLAPRPRDFSLVGNSTVRNMLWFGHATNISFLLEWLRELHVPTFDLRLQILTGEQGFNLLRTGKLSSPTKIKCFAGLWSLSAMISAAERADLCVIPCGVADQSKRGASSNRLLTALSLGLPVAADLLDSYVEYKSYFSELRGAEFLNLLESPTGHYRAVLAAQQTAVTEHSIERIGDRWLRFFLGIVRENS